jgi:signal transduction histidine kinase
MWFPAPGEVLVVDPATVRWNRSEPSVVVTSVVTRGPLRSRIHRMRHWSGAQQISAVPYMVSLDPDMQTLRIDFTGTSFLQPARVVFRYRLEGFESNWVQAGLGRSVTYTNLWPGEYTFHVTARNNHGVWSSQEASVRILVLPKWWQTSWALVMAVAGVLGVAIAGYKARISFFQKRNLVLEVEISAREFAEVELKDLSRQMVSAQEEDRSRIARDLHDDISQRLHGAGMDVEMALRTMGANPDGAAVRLERVQVQLDEVAEDARNLSHELHPAVLELLGLTAALEGLCEDFESNYGVVMEVSVAELESNEVPAEAALCLYRIAQEALRNIAKHAGASNAVLELSVQSGHARLRIRDKGAGFDPSSKRAGLGLASIRERARLLNGTASLSSDPGKGTEVLVDIPV